MYSTIIHICTNALMPNSQIKRNLVKKQVAWIYPSRNAAFCGSPNQLFGCQV